MPLVVDVVCHGSLLCYIGAGLFEHGRNMLVPLLQSVRIRRLSWLVEADKVGVCAVFYQQCDAIGKALFGGVFKQEIERTDTVFIPTGHNVCVEGTDNLAGVVLDHPPGRKFAPEKLRGHQLRCLALIILQIRVYLCQKDCLDYYL